MLSVVLPHCRRLGIIGNGQSTWSEITALHAVVGGRWLVLGYLHVEVQGSRIILTI
jgi:hypothetical protein